MIVKFTLELDLPKALKTHNLGSVLQGVLMEQLNTETASVLHQHRYNPLKQRLYFEDDKAIWEIVSLEEKLSNELLTILPQLTTIHIKKHQQQVPIKGLSIQKTQLSEFIKSAMEGETKRFIKLKILTPTSFKINGDYTIFPDVRMMLRSAMLTFDYFSQDTKIYDHEMLDFLEENIHIVDYQLKSTRFELERVKIPSFKGSLTLRVDGSEHIRKLINLILTYGELSGIGIKTSIGMGCIKRG